MRRRKTGDEADPKSYYHISAVAQRYKLHPQTLRLYEREGLLKPSRSVGNTRLYSEEDLKRLEIILNLIRDLGVNLAGVEVILNMRQNIERIEAEVNAFLDYVRGEYFSGRREGSESRKKSLVRTTPGKLVKIEKPD
ncbi:MAG: MerR family transcriptional regulator [Candidatus Aminicenantales bacterium]|jgi:MerR family transcriptional regulator/heat shock protein HspR